MIKTARAFFLLVSVLALAACDGPVITDRQYDGGPYLEGFHLVDSYYVNSEVEPRRTLRLDPYLDDGLFEIYWYVDSFHSYRVTVSLNDRPSLRGALIVGSDLCGPGRSCDYDGLLQCEYTPDFYLGCGIDAFDAEANLRPVEQLFSSVPEHLYMVLEVCDTAGIRCEFSTLPVVMY